MPKLYATVMLVLEYQADKYWPFGCTINGCGSDHRMTSHIAGSKILAPSWKDGTWRQTDNLLQL